MTQRKVKKEVKTVVGLFGLSILIGIFTVVELTTNKAKPKEDHQLGWHWERDSVSG